MSETKKFVANFSYERSTKNTHRFQEDVENTAPRIGTLYLQKWAVGSVKNLKEVKLKVTVEVLE